MAEGDLITYLNVWKAWEENGRSGKWAAANYVAHRSMLRAADIRNQLQRHLRWVCTLSDLKAVEDTLWPPCNPCCCCPLCIVGTKCY